MNAEALDYHFIDTNILVYAHDCSAGEKCDISKEIIAKLWESHLGCLSIQVLQEFYVNVTRKIPGHWTQPVRGTSSRIFRSGKFILPRRRISCERLTGNKRMVFHFGMR